MCSLSEIPINHWFFSSTQSKSAGRKHLRNHMGTFTADERRFHCLHPSARCWERVWSGTFRFTEWTSFTLKKYWKRRCLYSKVEFLFVDGGSGDTSHFSRGLSSQSCCQGACFMCWSVPLGETLKFRMGLNSFQHQVLLFHLFVALRVAPP